MHHWDRLMDVREGDVIFHCADGFIQAICSGTLILQSSIGGKLSQKEDIKMRRTFSPDYKVAAVKLVTEQGYSVAQACSELGIGETALRRWIK
ncbi:transposase, partial [Gallibacterium anatis]|uniref:transposase n=1 Tax=Gallibacterium anatis TaxID=750 RepID=UPI003D70602A